MGSLMSPFIVHRLLLAEVDVVATDRLNGGIGIASMSSWKSPVMHMLAPASINDLSVGGSGVTRFARGSPVTRITFRVGRWVSVVGRMTGVNGNSKGVVGEDGRCNSERSAMDPLGWGLWVGGVCRALSNGM